MFLTFCPLKCAFLFLYFAKFYMMFSKILMTKLTILLNDLQSVPYFVGCRMTSASHCYIQNSLGMDTDQI